MAIPLPCVVQQCIQKLGNTLPAVLCYWSHLNSNTVKIRRPEAQLCRYNRVKRSRSSSSSHSSFLVGNAQCNVESELDQATYQAKSLHPHTCRNSSTKSKRKKEKERSQENTIVTFHKRLACTAALVSSTPRKAHWLLPYLAFPSNHLWLCKKT